MQGFQRDVLGHQQFQPVEQLAGAGLLLQAGQVADVEEGFHGCRQQLFLQTGEVHVHNLLHHRRIGELDVVEETAAQKRVGQFFFIVGRDEHQWAVLGLDQLACFITVELHAVEFAQQVVGELDVGLVNFVNQQCHRLVGREGLPQHTLDDVVVDVLHLVATVHARQLAVTQAAHGVVFVQTLLRLGGALDVPLQQRQVQRLCHLFGQHGFASARFALDQQGALERDGGVDGQHQVGGGHVVV